MSGLAFDIEGDELRQLIATIEKLGSNLTGEELQLLMGTAIREVVRSHFYRLNSDTAHHQSARSLGATSTGFYLEAGDRTQAPRVEDESILISIDQQGLAQRYFGGDIQAKDGGFLTIPATAEAYGKRAREFDNLRLIMFPSGLAALAERDAPNHEGDVYYWLVRSVHQEPDRTVLPEEREMFDPALEAVRDYSDRLMERKAA